MVPEVAVLRCRTARGLLRVRPVQQDVHPKQLRRSRRGVLAPRESRDHLGRRMRTTGGDQRPRRVRVHGVPDAARPQHVQGGPGEVRPPHRRARRSRQRSGPHSTREEPVLALHGGQRRAPLGQRSRIPLSLRRRAGRAGCFADASPGPEIEAGAPVTRRPAGLGYGVLSLPGGDDRWHPGSRDADGLVRRSRIRDLSARREPWHGPVGPRDGPGDEVVRPWLPHPWPVRKDGKEIGVLTALAISPRLKKNIGYAWVPTTLSILGTEIEIVTPAGPRRAIVVKRPFIDPKKDVPKS